MIVLSKKNIITTSVFLAIVICFLMSFSAIAKGNRKHVDASYNKTIVLDAGHGGIDAGVSGKITGVKESELNLAVCRKTERLLSEAGYTVVLTRKTDAGLYGIALGSLKKRDMKKRKEIIESVKPDVVVSVHMNQYSMSSRRGAQVFFNEQSENGKSLANCVQKSFNLMPEATRTCEALRGDYYILNCTPYTSIICECGFLSNPEEERLLISDEYQQKIAYAIFKGIVDYLSIN